MSGPVQSVDEFIQVARRSGLVDEDRLAAAAAPWLGRTGPPPEPMLGALADSGLLTHWQIEQLLKGRYKGFFLGRYRLLRLLGAGGMSSVYLARHASLGSTVAVKVLPVKRAGRRSYLARFEREARQSARLNHPNIVRTFDLDAAGAIHFIVMEYVEGIDLHAKVKRDGPLPVREAAEYVRQAATGLQHAHDEGLIHRDVKPANLMLDARGTVKLLDLGLALAGGDGDESLTREHDERVLGTADYLAPEQSSDSHRADRRSDVYSLGCTLHYLLTAAPPFASGTLADRIRAQVSTPPPNLLERRPDVPIPIADLYFRMLEKDPDGRPQTAREVADALGIWLAATAATATAGRPGGPRPPLPRRTVGGRAGAGGIAVIGGSSGIGPGAGTHLGVPGSRSGPPSSSDVAGRRAAEPIHRRPTDVPERPPSGAVPRRHDVAGLPPGGWLAVVLSAILAATSAAALVWWLR